MNKRWRSRTEALLLLLLLLHGSCLPCLHAWREVSKPCDPKCTAIGNCNHEFGTCECPFGLTGPACEVDVVPACRPSGKPGALPFIGTWLIKSCECWRQLHQADKTKLEDKLFVIQSTIGHIDNPCFERQGVPANQQYSDVPEQGAPGVKWYHPPPADSVQPLAPVEGAAPKAVIQGHMVQYQQMPLDKCQNRCHEHGACLLLIQRDHGPSPNEPPQCHCMRGYREPDCILSELGDCLNRCGGHGVCHGGFCKCEQGYWGMDCTRTKAYEPDPASPAEVSGRAYNLTSLRIYRYEMPWHAAFFTEPRVHEGNQEYNDGTYGAWEQFFNQFSTDWVTRTENPHEANLFYVPVLMFMRTDNTGIPQPFLQHAVHYLRQNHPALWARNDGKDHFVWLSNDQGACDVESDSHLQNLIKVVHFGMDAPMPWRTHAVHPVPRRELKVTNNKELYHCFLAAKDVAAPDNRHRVRDAWMSHVTEAYKDALEGKPRPHLLFFGGGIRPHDPSYAGGARLEFQKHVLHKNHSDVKYGGGYELYRQSTFCLCPYGAGFGSRIGHAMMGACIPIILQDNVHQPLEDVLDYTSFSIRMRKTDVPRMMEVLRSISPQQIQAYRQNMHEAHLAFTWSVMHGGQAYNYTIKSLHRKLINLWAYHY